MGGRIRSNFILFFLYFHSFFYFPIFYTETIFRKIIKKKKKENEGKKFSLFLGNYSRNKVI